MELNLVAEFVGKTGASRTVAHNCLQAKGWDLASAIADYLNANSSESSNNGRPAVSKCDSFDVPDYSYKKLARGISRATDNVNLVSKARSELGLDVRESKESRESRVYSVNQYCIETPVFTFTLPDLSIFSDDFRQFLEKDLIEMSSLVSLEQSGRLNWWSHNGVCQRLWPLATTGDGNCLLHAASLGMWGFHDRLLTLRNALHDFLSGSECRSSLWRRWRWQLTRLNAEAGLVYTEEEWRKEWNAIVSMASSTPRNCSRRRSLALERSGKDVPENATYESLEEIHVLALSHVLKRPIIVIADTMLKDVHGEALAPILFGGIYLPLEIPSTECHRSPLVLTYDAAHFSALVVMDKEKFADRSPHPPAVIPLTDSDHKLLPLQFSFDPGELFLWGRDDKAILTANGQHMSSKEVRLLLAEYLDLVQVPLVSTPLSDELDLDLDLDTPGDEEDIEKRFIEAADCDQTDDVGLDTGLFLTNRSRAAKQFQSVAKQFGSIGKSVSKKLKKNLGTITKMTRSNSQKKDNQSRPRVTSQDHLLCARLHTETKHEYQGEMIKNYLNTARDRFERDKRLKTKTAEETGVTAAAGAAAAAGTADDERLQEQAKLEGPKSCITPGCDMYGTVLTSYLCTSCYEKQRQQELSASINSPSLPRAMRPNKAAAGGGNSVHEGALRYGTGRSTFYMEASPNSYEATRSFNLNSRTLKPADETLYLSNSTFYNDKGSGGFYPRDWRSSPAGSSTLPLTHYSLPNDYQDRPKTWQEGIGNQIDGLGSVTLPSGFSSGKQTSKSLSSNGSSGVSTAGSPGLTRRIQSYNLARDTYQVSAKPEHQSVLSGKPAVTGVRTGTHVTNITISNMVGPVTPPQAELLPDIEHVSSPSSQVKPLRLSAREQSGVQVSRPLRIPVKDNYIIPVRQSSQNSADDLVRESTDYLANNSIVERKNCLNVTCTFYGSPNLDNYCSKCYKGRLDNLVLESAGK